MTDSVSFIVPVRNLPYGLRDRVAMILEILAELTDTFDVLVVNCGSCDETRDAALELVREYPQVAFLDGHDGGDVLAAVEAAIHRTRGETIFVYDPSSPLRASALRSLWCLRQDDDLVMAQSRSDDANSSLQLTRGTRRSAIGQSGLQMIRRPALVPQPRRVSPPSTSVERLTRMDLADEPLESLRLPRLLRRMHSRSH